MCGDLVSIQSVVIDRHFVDSPLKPFVVVAGVSAYLDGMRWVEQQRRSRVRYRADRRTIDVISRTCRSDHGGNVVPDVPLETEGYAAGR